MIVVGIIGIIIAIAIPGWIRARSQTRMRACQENLTKIDGAIQQLALEMNLAPNATIVPGDLLNPGEKKGFLTQFPTCPSGYTYTVSTIAQEPICTSALPGHSLAEIGTVVVAGEAGGGS